MCLESAWRTVPLTGAANPRTIGVTGTNPHRFMICDPGGGFPVKPVIEVADQEIDGDIELHRTIYQGNDYKGSFPFKVDPENLYYPALGIFGTDIQTTAQAADSTHSPAAFKHNFKPGKYTPSYTVEEIFGDATYGQLTSGVLMQRLDLTLGKTVTAKLNAYGFRQMPNRYTDATGADVNYNFGSTATVIPAQMGGDGAKTLIRTATPTYIDVPEQADNNGPLTFKGITNGTQAGFATAYLIIDGAAAAVQILEGSSFHFERSLEEFMTGGSGPDMGACVANEFMCGGTLNILFQDNSIPQATLQHAKCALNIRINGALIGTSGQKYGMEIYFPWITFLDAGLTINATALLTGGQFRGKKDPTFGASCQLSLWNTVDNTNLGGTSGSSPGGLGGWSNS